MDLSGINIQNSEIVGGKFINTNFQDSNFRQVKLNPSVLPKAIINFKVLESIEQGKSSFSGHSKPITCIKFSPEGHFLVTGSEDRTLRIWEARSGHTLVVLEGHSDIIFAIAISEDSSEIVSGGRRWNSKTVGCCHRQLYADIHGDTGKRGGISVLCGHCIEQRPSTSGDLGKRDYNLGIGLGEFIINLP